VVDHS